jgi:4-amino-4-deoxy-L-arabinose transferase-like glycosyltransferase
MSLETGTSRHSTADRVPTMLLVIGIIVMVAVLYLPGLGHLKLINEEPRRALVARNMLETGDYVVPRLLGQIYIAKPPLFNWLIVAASYPGGSVTEFTARLPSVMSLALLAVTMVIGMRRYFSAAGLAMLGGALVLAPELMLKGFQAEIELLFTFLVTLSLWSWFWAFNRNAAGARLWMFPCTVVGFSFLAKGPPALLFFYLGTIPYLIYKKRLRHLIDPWHGVGVAVIILMVSIWLAGLVWSAGLTPVWEAAQWMVARGSFKDPQRILIHLVTYPTKLLAAILPFSLLFFLLPMARVRHLVRGRFKEVYVFAGLALTANLLVYLTRSAQVRYFLPMLPTALVLCVVVFEAIQYRPDDIPHPVLKILNFLTKSTAALAVAGTAVYFLAISRPLWQPSAAQLFSWPVNLAVGVLLAIGSGYLMKTAYRKGYRVLPAAFIGVLILFRILYVSQVIPHKAQRFLTTRNEEAVLALIARQLPDTEATVRVVGRIPFNLYFYDRAGMLIPPQVPYPGKECYFFRHHRHKLPPPDLGREIELFQTLYDKGELILSTPGP